MPMPPTFAQTLRRHQLDLTRGQTTVLQVNLGLLCNQACRHCHLSAGPGRGEVMDTATVQEVLAYARRGGFATVDITGGAPELNPNLEILLEGLRGLACRVILRANLTALLSPPHRGLIPRLAAGRVAITASFPSLSAQQAQAQRGEGVFEQSLNCLRLLNQAGYGQPGTNLQLDLVVNPAGAFQPPEQAPTEKRFRQVLAQRWGIAFNSLHVFANVPLGRFKDWLVETGGHEAYVRRLAEGFNPCALPGVMCRGLLSVAWDGFLYDCDFNQAAGLPLGGQRTHVSQMEGPPPVGQAIAVGEHCFTCTAGAGFT
ncbi:MAG: arsenosugar biosynthesis radical SAM protein ArsS [Desulfarculus sp.]|nr:arsenosugar biosynthesis radical SAM protein ArsS [Desulfarculus sp.]